MAVKTERFPDTIGSPAKEPIPIPAGPACVIDAETGLTITIAEMTHEQLIEHATELESLLNNILRIGNRVYYDHKGTPAGAAFLRAVQLCGDEATKQRVEAADHRREFSGRTSEE